MSDPAPDAGAMPAHYAILGNPNTGKTTLFNRLCGMRAKTANFPGSTVEARIGVARHDEGRFDLTDLPGIYGLNLDRPESATCKAYLDGRIELNGSPDAVLVVADAANLRRNLMLVSQALQQGVPTVVALTMIDLARRQGLDPDLDELARRLDCDVVAVNGRTGEGLEALIDAMRAPRCSAATLPSPVDAQAAAEWSETVADACGAGGPGAPPHPITDRLDAVCTHPVWGLLVFAVVMAGLFFTIFSLAGVPMDLIEGLFGTIATALAGVLPAGAIRDLLVDGVVGGVAGTVVFLPQICLLFFLISLLEDTGYLARASFVMDRHFRRFGLPGQAFVPLLSAHACAIPAIMSSRLIPGRLDRLAVILVAPFMSCSARLPVYVLLIGILFGDRPVLAGLAFSGCYALGAITGLLAALAARRTILRGPATPMVLELPTYKLPSLRTALITTLDRGAVFLRKAGTVIVAICVVLWWLSAYPTTDPPAAATALEVRAAEVETADPAAADALREEAAITAARHASATSFAGRLGHAVEPAFAPLGCDWQLSVGVLTSFAAREVFVSTLSVIFAASEDVEDPRVIDRIRTARRDDGAPVFTTSTAAALLVFYVLAMQCLPTLAVTRREAGGWRWALLQLGAMTVVAYVAALLVRAGCALFGIT